MRKYWIFILSGILIWGWFQPSQAQKHQKLAQSGFQFLSVVSDARAAGMGNAVNSIPFESSSLFFNPAGMAEMAKAFDLTVSDNRWIADIHHNTMSFAIRPFHGHYGVLGFSAQSVNYGDNIFGTVIVPESKSAKGYMDTGEIQPSAVALGVGYAKALTDRFSVGGQIRWVQQDFGNMAVPVTVDSTTKERYKESPLAFDFGTLFKTGLKSLTFGMSVRNFSREVKYIRESFELPLTFTLGIHADLMDWIQLPHQSAILSIDAKHYRSHPEQICIGLDYRWMKMLSLRLGYVSSTDETAFTYGFGFSAVGLSVDYAYTPYGIFDSVQRVTVRLSR